MNNKFYKFDFTQRNVAIDIFRALTMFAMIFVNDLGTVNGVPHWLEHSSGGEDFIGLADYVFPVFLFVVGMSIPFAIERRYSKGASVESTIGHILLRTFALLLMGAFISNTINFTQIEGLSLFSPYSLYRIGNSQYSMGVYFILMFVGFILVWNQYAPTDDKNLKRLFTVLKFAGMGILLFLAITFRSVNGNVFVACWGGILGIIGWTYLLCSFIYIFSRHRLKYLILVWLVFITICILGTNMNEIWGGQAILSLPKPNIYNEFLGILRVGNGAYIAFTMGGIILSTLCVKYANMAHRKKIIFAVISFTVFFLLGVLARKFWILSKLGCTPTWVFHVTATAIAAYAIIYWLVENGKGSWFNIIKPAGTATLTCYCISHVAYGLAMITGIVLPDRFAYGWIGILNCLCFSFVIIGVTQLLGKLNIKLKI